MLLMFCILKKKKIDPAYVSKHNSNCEKQVILLIIPNGKGREVMCEGREANIGGRLYYLAVKKTISIIERNNV